MILLARHGQTDFNAPPVRIQGSLDPPLNETGRAQARELAEAVANEGLRALYSSDMLRARQTAQIVAERVGLEPVVEPRVRECDWGSWEGMLVDDIAREQPELWQAWLAAVKGSSDPNVIPGETSSGLGRYVRGLARGEVRFATLPASPQDGGDEEVFVPDSAGIADLMTTMVPLPTSANPGDRVRVRLLSGVGPLDAAAMLQSQLVPPKTSDQPSRLSPSAASLH